MPLIDGPLIELPGDADEEGWQDSLAGRLLLIVMGGLFLRVSFQLWTGAWGRGWLALGLTSMLSVALGIQIIIIALSDIDMERWARPLTYAAAILMSVIVLLTVLVSAGEFLPKLNTDALAFSSYSLELLADGRNPYAASMLPARDLEGAGRYWTERVDGTLIRSFSYPAGAVLAFVPQYLLIGRDPMGIRLTLMLSVFAIAMLSTAMLPARLAAGGMAALLVARNQWLAAAGGILIGIWLLPTVLGLWAWSDERWLWAAGLLGISAGTKQFVWLALPFLAVWLFREQGWRVTAQALGVGTAVFAAMNVPFLLDAPGAWIDGVLTPVSGSDKPPLVRAGSAFVALESAPAIDIPRVAHKILVGVAGAGGLLAYWWTFPRFKWAAWIAPPFILFWHSRSLMSYFTPWVLVGILACAASYGRLRSPGEVLAGVRLSTRRVNDVWRKVVYNG